MSIYEGGMSNSGAWFYPSCVNGTNSTGCLRLPARSYPKDASLVEVDTRVAFSVSSYEDPDPRTLSNIAGESATNVIATADCDNDGLLDIFIGPDKLYRNLGGGTFETLNDFNLGGSNYTMAAYTMAAQFA
jgi:hypothetical protein